MNLQKAHWWLSEKAFRLSLLLFLISGSISGIYFSIFSFNASEAAELIGLAAITLILLFTGILVASQPPIKKDNRRYCAFLFGLGAIWTLFWNTRFGFDDPRSWSLTAWYASISLFALFIAMIRGAALAVSKKEEYLKNPPLPPPNIPAVNADHFITIKTLHDDKEDWEAVTYSRIP